MLSQRNIAGFTLIEVLVALALMLAGLAGAGIVLGQSIQYERDSSHRRAAIRFAGSLAEVMRAHDGDSGASLPPDSQEILDWSAEVNAALPAGAVASVVVDDAMPAAYLISIEWPVAGLGVQRIVLPVTT